MEAKDLENEAGYSLFSVSSIWLGGFETRPWTSEAAFDRIEILEELD